VVDEEEEEEDEPFDVFAVFDVFDVFFDLVAALRLGILQFLGCQVGGYAWSAALGFSPC
jgi:hypothetical protein